MDYINVSASNFFCDRYIWNDLKMRDLLKMTSISFIDSLPDIISGEFLQGCLEAKARLGLTSLNKPRKGGQISHLCRTTKKLCLKIQT